MNKIITRKANSIARQHGHGRATSIVLGKENKILTSLSYGHRKKTTGQYVPNAYLKNFGWKNTYYQPALCSVMVCLTLEEKLKILVETL